MGQRVDAVVHNFADSLEWSQDLSNEPAWAEFYKRLFPDLVTSVRIDCDCELQRHGVDRILHFGNGMQLTVDEKNRWKKYKDVLLERWSDYDRRTPGWTIDDGKICDYIAYVIHPHSLCYFMPYPILRMAFTTHWEEWQAEFERKTGYEYRFAPNKFNGRSWKTANIPVEWDIVKAALCQQMCRRYSGDIVLPVARINKHESNEHQLTLNFAPESAA